MLSIQYYDYIVYMYFSDAATIIVVNLYIRSFAKIDDVKMVKFNLLSRKENVASIANVVGQLQMYFFRIFRSTVFKLRSVRRGTTIDSVMRVGSPMET